MKIWTNKKTGETYPDRGGDFTCYEEDMSKPKIDIFIRGIGWKKYPTKNWETKEIPDLPYKDDVKVNPNGYRNYAKIYGQNIAMAQLYCAEFCKPSWNAVLLDPNYPNDEIQKWFYETFNNHNPDNPEYMKKHIWDFITSEFMVFGKCMFDIIKFEVYLTTEFGYDRDSETESIEIFMIRRFGKDNADKFRKTFIDLNLNEKGKVA